MEEDEVVEAEDVEVVEDGEDDDHLEYKITSLIFPWNYFCI